MSPRCLNQLVDDLYVSGIVGELAGPSQSTLQLCSGMDLSNKEYSQVKPRLTTIWCVTIFTICTKDCSQIRVSGSSKIEDVRLLLVANLNRQLATTEVLVRSDC